MFYTSMRWYLKSIANISTNTGPAKDALKKVKLCILSEKEKEQVQMLDINAPLYRDVESFAYCVGGDSIDEYLPNPMDEIPFLQIKILRFSGFLMEPMHIFFAEHLS